MEHPRDTMTAPPISIRQVTLKAISALRDAYRAEQDCQIVHDSIHARRGWTRELAIAEGDRVVAYASLAVDGPWRDKPTLYELYVVPERRSRAFALFEAFLDATKPPGFEVQSNDLLLTTLAVTFARELTTEKVVFRDHETTSHTIPGATMRCLTPAAEIQDAMTERAGGGEWALEVAGVAVGKGGVLFHYNPPYGDIYMEVYEPNRRRGYGGYLVQELKRLCRELGAVPGARCDPTNTASRRTLQRAGLVPYAHILIGSFREDRQAATERRGHCAHEPGASNESNPIPMNTAARVPDGISLSRLLGDRLRASREMLIGRLLERIAARVALCRSGACGR